MSRPYRVANSIGKAASSAIASVTVEWHAPEPERRAWWWAKPRRWQAQGQATRSASSAINCRGYEQGPGVPLRCDLRELRFHFAALEIGIGFRQRSADRIAPCVQAPAKLGGPVGHLLC